MDGTGVSNIGMQHESGNVAQRRLLFNCDWLRGCHDHRKLPLPAWDRKQRQMTCVGRFLVVVISPFHSSTVQPGNSLLRFPTLQAACRRFAQNESTRFQGQLTQEGLTRWRGGDESSTG